jgi:hypothetical protein
VILVFNSLEVALRGDIIRTIVVIISWWGQLPAEEEGITPVTSKDEGSMSQ